MMFGIEEMSRSFEQRSSVLVLATVIAAGLTSQAVLGNYTYFGIANGSMPIGVPLACVVGGLFSRVVVAIMICTLGAAGGGCLNAAAAATQSNYAPTSLSGGR
jgi:hypothetical protein